MTASRPSPGQPTLVEQAAPSGAGRSAARILAGATASLCAITLAALVIDPWAPPGCPGATATGLDCARFGGAGRLYAAFLLVRGNAAATPEAAIPKIDHAIQIRPNFVYAFNARGLAYDAAGRTGEALAAYDRALRLAPRYIGARANRAALYQRLGRGAEAARDFDAVYAAPPDSHKREAVVRYARSVDCRSPSRRDSPASQPPCAPLQLR